MFSRRLDDETPVRSFNVDDAAALHDAVQRNLGHLREWLPWPDASRTLGDRWEFIRRASQQEAEGDGFQAGIWRLGDLAGGIGFQGVDHTNLSTSIGYWLGAAYQGKGIVTRSCQALVDYALAEMKLNRVEIRCAVENTRSRAIPERLGFAQEGVLRQALRLHDRYVDLVVYSMLAEHWRAGPDREGPEGGAC